MHVHVQALLQFEDIHFTHSQASGIDRKNTHTNYIDWQTDRQIDRQTATAAE